MLQIAIDGPAGAGKSTVAKEIAKRLQINYLDTGATYRAVALALLQKDVCIADHDAVRSRLSQIDVSIGYDERGQRVFVNGVDVSDEIRTPAVSKGASDVAVIPEVRKKLVEIQRAAADQYDIVMDGRDIGTYVLPHANVKIFLTASSKERARRRRKDLQKNGIEQSLEELEKEIIARDHTDSTREFAPLLKAEDALQIDSTEMTAEEVIQVILKKIDEAKTHV